MFDSFGQLFFMLMGKVALHTLGCKLNFAETATIARQFTDRGYEVVAFGNPADVVVLNTCTVTEKADRECRQLVRRALRRSPSAYVIVTGCYAQLQPEEIGAIEGVDLVAGTQEKFRLFEHATFEKHARAVLRVSSVHASHNVSMADSAGYDERTRAFVKIQDGCDYQCSFCTIPLARGPSRSVSVQDIVARAKEIAAGGYKEIVLTGVNVGDYTADNRDDLLEVIKALESVERIERIRISSVEPNLLDDELLGYWIESTKVCNHFHIPLQSGSDAVLKRMKRRYNTNWYAGRIESIKAAAPNAGIGADVIVGFPGETDTLFEETYQFLVEQPLSYLHVFSYSERSNTEASVMDGKIDPHVRSERSERLRILSDRKKRVFQERLIGTVVPVLFETPVGNGIQSGLTGEYVRIHVSGPGSFENEVRQILITGIREGVCIGEIAEVAGVARVNADRKREAV